MKINLRYKKKKFKIDAKFCNWFEKFSGLMFVKREKAKALLFGFQKPVRQAIHSYFVFFPFVAVWLDGKNKIVEVKSVKPFNLFVRPKKNFCKLVEVPINKKYKTVAELLLSSATRKI